MQAKGRQQVKEVQESLENVCPALFHPVKKCPLQLLRIKQRIL
jgi:hypothetical protein